MNEDNHNHNSNFEALNLPRIGHATRFAIACVVLGFSYLSIRSSLSISRFERVFEDMLGSGTRLPALTTFVMGVRPAFVALSFCIPVACIAIFFIRDIARSLYCLGVLALIAIIECIVLFHALSSPLVEIISGMQDGGPQ